jgi:ABC-type microcin C transport system permease subunit YejB
LLGETEMTENIQKIIDKMIEERKSQKLWNMVRNELGYSIDCCDEIVDLVEKWLPKEQSAAGSQNVNTELLVDGFNHCLNKMKEKLR